MSLTDELRSHAKARGIDLLGCTSVTSFLVQWDEPVEVDPRKLLPGAQAVVVVGTYLNGFETREPSEPGAPRGKYGPWTRASLPAARHMETVIKEFLQTRGFQAAVAYEIPCKLAAVRAGIALYGKNAIVHADGFGSYLKIATLVTDAQLDCTDMDPHASDCDDCRACLDACPTGALWEPYRLRRERCICNWMWGRPIPPDDRKKVGTHIHRCSFCQDVCPMNHGLPPRTEFPFELEDVTDRPELIPLLLGDEHYYGEALPEFVMGAGVETLRRNVAIALGNCGDPEAVPALVEALGTENGPVRGAVAWALGRLGGEVAGRTLTAALTHEKDDEVRHEIESALRAAQGLDEPEENRRPR